MGIWLTLGGLATGGLIFLIYIIGITIDSFRKRDYEKLREELRKEVKNAHR